MTEYTFTVDWFTARIPVWESLLKPLVGQPCQCLEIGAYEGRSAFWTAENICTHPDARVTVVDPWNNPAVEATFDHNLAQCPARDRVVRIKGPSWQVLRGLPLGAFDFVYVDGSHEAQDVLEDAVLSLRLLRAGGILIFDDYLWDSGNRSLPPRVAIGAVLTMYAHRLTVLHHGWQVVVQVG